MPKPKRETWTKSLTRQAETEMNRTKNDIADGAAHIKRFADYRRRAISTETVPQSPTGDPGTDLTEVQEAIWRMHQDGYSNKEIAKAMEIKEATVRSHLCRAKSKKRGDLVPKAPAADMIAAAESAGYMGNSIWKWRAKKLKQMSKAKGQHENDSHARNIAVRVTAEHRKSPFLQGFSPIRVTLEGDAIYIFSPGIWREMSTDIKTCAVLLRLEEYAKAHEAQ